MCADTASDNSGGRAGSVRPVTPLSLSVVVPTYRRPESLAACLTAIAAQKRPIDEVLVVHRADDHASAAVLRDRPSVRAVHVARPGVLAAMAAGAEAASGDLIGFVDDDASPRPDWSERVLVRFADPRVGGVCGRDVIERPSQTSATGPEVGKVTAWGRTIGNHHLGTGAARDVDLLKGANMVLRREALALPVALRGAGAQAHFEVATSLWARNRGWVLQYDPAVLVDHAPAERFDADARAAPSAAAVDDAADNLVFCLLSERRELLARRTAYGVLVGDRGTVGLARAAAAAVRRERGVLAQLVPSLRGQLRATTRVVRGRRVAMRTFGD